MFIWKKDKGSAAIGVVLTVLALVIVVALAYHTLQPSGILPPLSNEEDSMLIYPEFRTNTGEIIIPPESRTSFLSSYHRWFGSGSPVEADQIRFNIRVTNTDQTTPILVTFGNAKAGEGEYGNGETSYSGTQVCPGGTSGDGYGKCSFCANVSKMHLCDTTPIAPAETVEFRTEWLDIAQLCNGPTCPTYVDTGNPQPEDFLNKTLGVVVYAEGEYNLYAAGVPAQLNFYVAKTETTTTLPTTTSLETTTSTEPITTTTVDTSTTSSVSTTSTTTTTTVAYQPSFVVQWGGWV